MEEEYCPLPGALFTMHAIHGLRSQQGTVATGMKNSISRGSRSNECNWLEV